jgi:fumarate hydratase class II
LWRAKAVAAVLAAARDGLMYSCEFMIEGAELNEPKLKENIERSVMMVTALSPVIGYDQASVISPTTPSTTT